MIRIKNRIISLRHLLATFWPLILIVGLGFAVTLWFVKPAPPTQIVIATGPAKNAYNYFATRYAKVLKRNGIHLEIKNTSGSQENLRLLQTGQVDVAFVQSGTDIDADLMNTNNDGDFLDWLISDGPATIYSLGSLYYEPLWVFYRDESFTSPPQRLADLSNKRIAISGEDDSIRLLVAKLLAANEITLDERLVPLADLGAAEALQQGKIDAAFVIAPPKAPAVRALLRSPEAKVMDFIQADAYVRRFPYLVRIVLPEGIADFARNIPPQETHLLATTVNLAVTSRLHPALATLLIQTAGEVHGGSGFFNSPGQFPAYLDHSHPLSPQAENYYRSGPPFLQRYLPFWAASLAQRTLILLIPLLALLWPLIRFAPAIYSYSVRSKIFRCYGELKFLEEDLKHNFDMTKHDEYQKRLLAIEEEANNRPVPLAFANGVYTLREHIKLVRENLTRLTEEHARSAQSSRL